MSESATFGKLPTTILRYRPLQSLAQRWFLRAAYRQRAGFTKEAIADWRKALELRPNDPMLSNELAWLLCTGPEKFRNADEAVKLGMVATAREPGEWSYHNTLGIALYRASRLPDAMEELKKSLKGSAGQTAGFDLYFLAMISYRQGNTNAAQSYYAEAIAWQRAQSHLPTEQVRELDAFAVEAAKTLGLPLESSGTKR